MLDTLNDWFGYIHLDAKNDDIMICRRWLLQVYTGVYTRIYTADASDFLASDWWRRVMHINEWYNAN